MTAEIHCHIPVRIRITGIPDDDQLGRLAAAIQEAVAQRIAFAERTIRAAAGGQPHDAISYAHPAAPVPSNASDEADGFTISSYAGGRPARAPAVPRRRWVVLRALNFRARIDDFLAALAHVRGETELPAAALYVDLAAQERWVAVWWVQTNVTIRLGDLENELVTRASELAHRQPNQVPAHLVSPFAAAWQDLGDLDDTGAMGGLPQPTAHNAYRVDGTGADATLRHGAWAIFALMLLPAVTVEDKLIVGPGERVTIPIADVTALVDETGFERRFGVGWRTYTAELSAERVEVGVLPLRVKRPVPGITALYLASQAAARLFGPDPPADTVGVQDLFLLTDAQLAQLPAALTAGPRAWAGDVAPASAAPDGPLEAGWPLVHLSAAIPVTDDLLGRAAYGSAARALAARIRAALAGDTGAREWPFQMYGLLHDALGEAPEGRPPGGTLFEHTLGELEHTSDLLRLFDTADDTGNWQLRIFLYQHAAATTYASHPRVVLLGTTLSQQREAARKNLYQAGGADVGWVDLERDPAQRVRVGKVFGDVDGIYITTRTEKQLRAEKAQALAQALVDQSRALVESVGRGQDAAEYTEEAFAREVLARAGRAIGITNDDFATVDIERSMRLTEVVATTVNGLPSFDVRFCFVDRVEDGEWHDVGREITQPAGEFEAMLIRWALGRAGEVYEAFGIGITVVGGIAFAFEAGLVAALVDLAGGAATVGVSITISEVIYIIRVVLKKEELSLRGFLFAALDGYINALTFRLGGIAGHWTATSLGTASVRRVIAGWVAERLVTGAVGGASSSVLELFARDIVDIVTGTGGWSGLAAYARSAGLGAVIGAAAEFSVTPALHALMAGGTSALESVAEVVARVRTEGITGLQFSAAITEAMANLRAALTELGEAEGVLELTKAITERLGAVVEGLGASAVARRVLELSGARFSQEATAGLQRFLAAADAAGSPQRALEAVRVFEQHPQETVHFLETLATLPEDAARHLAAGTFGSRAELAAFLGRIGRYQPSAQRALVGLLGELGLVAGPAVPGATVDDILQRQLDLALRAEAGAAETEADRLRGEALQKRQQADVTEAADPSRSRQAAALRQEAQALEDQANAVTGRAGELRTAAEGGPRSVVPTDEEVERAIDALESGTSPHGGPQAWVRIPAEDAALANPKVLDRLTRSLFRSRSGNRVVFRVQGGTGTDTSREYVHVGGQGGSVRIETGGNALNLNFGVYERAVEFLLKHRPGGRLVVFEVEEGWFSALRGISTPERGKPARLVVKDPEAGTKQRAVAPGIKAVPDAPRLVDVRAGVDQLQIPASLLHELQEFIVPGSGRELEFTP